MRIRGHVDTRAYGHADGHGWLWVDMKGQRVGAEGNHLHLFISRPPGAACGRAEPRRQRGGGFASIWLFERRGGSHLVELNGGKAMRVCDQGRGEGSHLQEVPPNDKA